MGKRDRRRKRERARAHQKAAATVARAPEPPRILFPSEAQPLVELHVDETADAETAALCRGYWEFSSPGVWARPVAELGSTSQIYKAVKGASHASLLTVFCPQCTAPVTVTSRSEMAATGWWASDMPTSAVSARSVCAECASATAAEKRRAAEQAEQREADRTARRVKNAEAWLERERTAEPRGEYPKTVMAALALLTSTQIMKKAGTTSIGPFNKLDYTLTGTPEGDIEAFKELHRTGWAAPTFPATTGAFAFDDDDSVRGVYVDQIPWTLPEWLEDDDVSGNLRAQVSMEVRLENNIDGVRAALVDIEADMALAYLDGLLIRKYREESVPEHRIPDAYSAIKEALNGGFVLEQVLAVCWSATAGAVAWGQRTPGLKPGAVSSASVTNLARRIEYAKDRTIPEYELPNWVPRPAMHSVALRMLAQHEKANQALGKFRALQQKVNSRQDDEMDADFVGDDGGGWTVPDFKSPQGPSGKAQQSDASSFYYAVVPPDGSLEFRQGTAEELRADVTLTGSGFVDRIMIDGTPTVNAYIGELVPATRENRNYVGASMLSLLGEGQEPLLGPIAFFAVTSWSKTPRGLDEEQQELLRTAHQAVMAKLHN
ncbi:hypothetical protein OG520_44815 (plasmid) [Streptomyces sp. NBC_00984]|uniref:hypothetical protein n=1 Tax=Streptomyces sp. NBC_00984 TaxID=2903700 RepID=UPI002F9078FB|nr:hypothetical protein OG520_44815 [Streptomyces sp. NBC_00984]